MGQMKPWCKWLPFVFIEWYAKRNCQLTLVNEKFSVVPFKGVYIAAGISGIERAETAAEGSGEADDT